MQEIHARYPFTSSTKEAVAEDDPNIVDLVTEDGSAALTRAVDRVESAIRDRNNGEVHPDTRTEVLSYPLARILVSMIGERVAYSRFARAEANGVVHELSKEAVVDQSKTNGTHTVESEDGSDREMLLKEFDMYDSLTERTRDDSYIMPLADYLPLAVAAGDEKWKLKRRTIVDGDVRIAANESADLIEAAVERRVSEGLPVSVPAPVSDELTEEVATLRDALDDVGLIRDIDTVAPDLFPPCMGHILQKVQNGEHLEHHARFALTAFLSNLGMSTDEIVELYTVNPGFAEDMTRYQTDHIQGNSGPIEYSAPACATMKAHGDCYSPDERCETIKHPMAYYERALDATDEDEIEDWREEVAEDETEEEVDERDPQETGEGASTDDIDEATDTGAESTAVQS